MLFLDSLVGVFLVLLGFSRCGVGLLSRTECFCSPSSSVTCDCACGAAGRLYLLDFSGLCKVNHSVLPLPGFWWQLGSGAGAAGGQSF